MRKKGKKKNSPLSSAMRAFAIAGNFPAKSPVERHAKRKFSLSRGNAVKPSDTNSFTDFLT